MERVMAEELFRHSILEWYAIFSIAAHFRACPFVQVLLCELDCNYSDRIFVTVGVCAPYESHTLLNSELSFFYTGCETRLEISVHTYLIHSGGKIEVTDSDTCQDYLCESKWNDLHRNSNLPISRFKHLSFFFFLTPLVRPISQIYTFVFFSSS